MGLLSALTGGGAPVLHALETPLQLTEWLLWYIFGIALAVAIVYVGLLLWTLSRHISHEPLAQSKPVPKRVARPPRHE